VLPPDRFQRRRAQDLQRSHPGYARRFALLYVVRDDSRDTRKQPLMGVTVTSGLGQVLSLARYNQKKKIIQLVGLLMSDRANCPSWQS